MAAVDGDMLILRYSGEVSTKARETRRRFVTLLLRNLRAALAPYGDPKIQRTHERTLVTGVTPEALEPAARVFGVQSVSLAERLEGSDLDALVREGVRVFAEPVRGKRYAVRARMVGDRGPVAFSGSEIERALGAALGAYGAKVDLGDPEFTARIEVHRGVGYAIRETRTGPAGLPLGCEGRALALVSGGFDSAVAAWQLMRRGVLLDFVFCNLGGDAHAVGTLGVLRRLVERWCHGAKPQVVMLDFEPVVEALQSATRPRYWQVLLKRRMLEAADRIASDTGADALVTGEAVGQVSSQTLENIAVISEVTRLPILRPLVGANKEEIVAAARHIGTAELSARVEEYCALNRRDPATAARLEDVRAEEAKLPEDLVARCLALAQRLDLAELPFVEAEIGHLAVGEPPPGAVLVDVRPPALYRQWHLDGALSLEWSQALRAFPSFSREQTYVVCCEYGILSAQLAHQMRRAGFDALHLEGGVRRARRKRVERS